MVWAGTQKVVHPIGDNSVLLITSTGFDANGEIGDVIDLYHEFVQFGKLPTDLVIFCNSAHATAVTDVVDFAVQGSYQNVAADFVDVGTSITDADVDNGGGAAERSVSVLTDISALPYRYWRVLCTTVGAGNTLEMVWTLV